MAFKALDVNGNDIPNAKKRTSKDIFTLEEQIKKKTSELEEEGKYLSSAAQQLQKYGADANDFALLAEMAENEKDFNDSKSRYETAKKGYDSIVDEYTKRQRDYTNKFQGLQYDLRDYEDVMKNMTASEWDKVAEHEDQRITGSYSSPFANALWDKPSYEEFADREQMVASAQQNAAYARRMADEKRDEEWQNAFNSKHFETLPDFAVDSMYDHKYDDDDFYYMVNNPEMYGTSNTDSNRGGGKSFSGTDKDDWFTRIFGPDYVYNRETLTDNEKALFNYIYKTQGRDKAMEFFDTIPEEVLNFRSARREAENNEAFGYENPLMANIKSVASNLFKPVTYAASLLDIGKDGKYTRNAWYNVPTIDTEGLTKGVVQKINDVTDDIIHQQIADELMEKYGSVSQEMIAKVDENINYGFIHNAENFGYQTLLSMENFLVNTGVANVIGGSAGLSQAATNWLDLGMMGSGAALDATKKSLDRGMTDGQSFLLGAIAGLAEVATEKVSIEALFSPKTGIKYVLDNFIAEGSEEVASDLINWAADVTIGQGASEWADSVREHNGDIGAALQEKLLDSALSFLGGAISGGIMGGVSQGFADIRAEKFGKMIKDMGTDGIEYIQSLIEDGKNSSNKQIKKIAEALDSQLKENGIDIENLDNKSIGRLNQLFLIEEENVEPVAEEPVEAEETVIEDGIPQTFAAPLTDEEAIARLKEEGIDMNNVGNLTRTILPKETNNDIRGSERSIAENDGRTSEQSSEWGTQTERAARRRSLPNSGESKTASSVFRIQKAEGEISYISNKTAKSDPELAEILSKAKTDGAKVKFYRGTTKVGNKLIFGNFDEKTGVIHVQIDSDTRTAMATYEHEKVHLKSVQNKSLVSDFLDSIRNTEEFSAVMDAYKQTYNFQRGDMTESEFELWVAEEILADAEAGLDKGGAATAYAEIAHQILDTETTESETVETVETVETETIEEPKTRGPPQTFQETAQAQLDKSAPKTETKPAPKAETVQKSAQKQLDRKTETKKTEKPKGFAIDKTLLNGFESFIKEHNNGKYEINGVKLAQPRTLFSDPDAIIEVFNAITKYENSEMMGTLLADRYEQITGEEIPNDILQNKDAEIVSAEEKIAEEPKTIAEDAQRQITKKRKTKFTEEKAEKTALKLKKQRGAWHCSYAVNGNYFAGNDFCAVKVSKEFAGANGFKDMTGKLPEHMIVDFSDYNVKLNGPAYGYEYTTRDSKVDRRILLFGDNGKPYSFALKYEKLFDGLDFYVTNRNGLLAVKDGDETVAMFARCAIPEEFENTDAIKKLDAVNLKSFPAPNAESNTLQQDAQEQLDSKLSAESDYVGEDQMSLFDSDLSRISAEPQNEIRDDTETYRKYSAIKNPGVNINNRFGDVDSIKAGAKTMETRTTRNLDAFIGKRIALIETGSGKAKIFGYATVNAPSVMSRDNFDDYYDEHRVGEDNGYYPDDRSINNYKYGYRLSNIKLVDPIEIGSDYRVDYTVRDLPFDEKSSKSPAKRESMRFSAEPVITSNAEDERYLELAKDPKKNEAELTRLVEEAALDKGYTKQNYITGSSKYTKQAYRNIRSESLDIASPKERFDFVYEECRKIGPQVTQDDFFQNTIAKFTERSRRPSVEPNYVSRNKNGEVSSEYWYTSEGVVRGSKHWGNGIRTCDWALDTVPIRQHDVTLTNKKYGFCKWSDFAFKDAPSKSIDSVTYDDEGNVIPLSKRFDDTVADTRFSAEPVFYSKLQREVDSMKQNKISADGVIPYLKGRGVKDEEIKWTGVQQFLEGKKSVTKEELSEFVAGNQIEIEEEVIDPRNANIPDEINSRIEEYSSERDKAIDAIKKLWRDETGTEFIMRGTQSYEFGAKAAFNDFVRRILKKQGVTPYSEGYSEKLLEVEEEHDLLRYKLLTNAQDADTFDMLYNDAIEDRVFELQKQHSLPLWSDHTVYGGSNYREILLKIPNSQYSNLSMHTHWRNSQSAGRGVLAHARIQDFDTDSGKMLFVEEIQSDWHNAGNKHGYSTKEEFESMEHDDRMLESVLRFIKTNGFLNGTSSEIDEDLAAMNVFLRKVKSRDMEVEYQHEGGDESAPMVFTLNVDGYFDIIEESAESFKKELLDNLAYIRRHEIQPTKKVPDAPFKDTYQDFVMKRLLREAAENNYDSIGWTTAEMQSDRWSDEFAEGYKIEYDQQIPKFMRKYVKQWGSTVEQTELPGGETVWSVPITDSMRESVMQGQPRFSAENEPKANRFARMDETENQENPSLITKNGSRIQRSKAGVGKEIGGKIYVHKNYADEVIPADIWEKAKAIVPDDFSYNTVVYRPGQKLGEKPWESPYVVRFDEAPDFDYAREPHPGKYVYVDTQSGKVLRTGNDNNIWHHKWQWVRNDYEGFDVKESYNWSKEWLKHISSPSGSLRVWNKTLRDNGLEVDVEEDPATRLSVTLIDPVEPSEGSNWKRTYTTKEAMEIAAEHGVKMWDVSAESEEKNPTSMTNAKNETAGTSSTYAKVFRFLGRGYSGRILDASSGMGYGTRIGRENYGLDIIDIEPYADPKHYQQLPEDPAYEVVEEKINEKTGKKTKKKTLVPYNPLHPQYDDYTELDHLVQNGEVESFDFIISNAVLNVLPQDQRDGVVAHMGHMLAHGGRMFINVRDDSEVRKLGNTPGNVKLGDHEAVESTHGSYQYGFVKSKKQGIHELKDYVQDVLGDGYTVEDIDDVLGFEEVSSPAVMVTKSTDASRFSAEEESKANQLISDYGIKIAKPIVADYSKYETLMENDRAARDVARRIKAVDKIFPLSSTEKTIARRLASDKIDEEFVKRNYPGAFNIEAKKDAILQLAELYREQDKYADDTIDKERSYTNVAAENHAAEWFALDGDENLKALKNIKMMNSNTPKRMCRSIWGSERGENIYNEFFRPVGKNEANRMRWVNKMYDRVKSIGKLTTEESAVVQKMLEGIDLDGNEKFRKDRVDKAVETLRQTYSDMYDIINAFLVTHGIKPIGFIKDYAPHAQPESVARGLDSALAKAGVYTNELPTSISGRTSTFKPRHKFVRNFLTRTGDQTIYDAVNGYQDYINSVSEVIFHTDDIIRTRGIVNHLRNTYSPQNQQDIISTVKEIIRSKNLDEKVEYIVAHNLNDGPVDSISEANKLLNEYIAKAFETKEESDSNTAFSEFVKWADNYANIIAGKQNWADRGLEYQKGRKSLNVGNRLVNLFRMANVSGNVSSVLNQAAQLPMIISELGFRNTGSIVKSLFNGDIRMTRQNSDFLVGKSGIDFITNTVGEMIVSGSFIGAEFVDSMISTIAVQGKLNEQIRKGKDYDDAMEIADEFARDIMGSRLKGEKPLRFTEKNIVSSIINMYQIEAANTWNHVVKDIPDDFKQIKRNKGVGAAVASLIGVILKTLITSFALNRLDDELYGGSPAPYDLIGLTTNFIASGKELTTNDYIRTMFDDVSESFGGDRIFDTEKLDDQFNMVNAVSNTIFNVSNDLPYVRNVAGALGLGDQTIGLPMVAQGNQILSAIESGKWDEIPENLLEALPSLVPFGRQLSKTTKGLNEYFQGGAYTASGRLKYPVEQNIPTLFQNALFGPYANKDAARYYAQGTPQAVSETKTTIYQDLLEAGYSQKEAYDTAKQTSMDKKQKEKAEDAGLDIKQALTLTEKLDALREQYRDAESNNVHVPEEEKMQAVIDLGMSDADTVNALSEFISDSWYGKVSVLSGYDVNPQLYVDFRRTLKEHDANGNGSYTNEELMSAIDSMDISTAQKAALWQTYTTAATRYGHKNPYDTRIGELIYAEMHPAQ